MVRDGTYLVGTTAMITEEDITKRDADNRPMILFQAELYRIRVEKKDVISPYLLLGILNSPVVQRQIRCKQFTRGVIDTLGPRINELILPIPKNEGEKRKYEEEIKEIIKKRAEYRKKMREIGLKIVPKNLDHKWKFE
ncbi:MAG: hypothetical protein DRO98_06450 [Archaeoglobales archaeon]|nr:MAG: hypothetical protein DRO29_03060 [Candidatus Bathyarchaeota archaeon]RLI85772.1 MAG: hypothetical protein DRO98_06450 [Archaeoglobales archaeon]